VIEVRVMGTRDEPAYEAFLSERPDALVYHSLPYRDLLVEHLGAEPEYLLAVDGGEVRGALPVMWTGDGDLRIANSLPYYGSHGSILASDGAARDALLAGWNDRASDPGTAAATLVTNPFSEPAIPEPVHTLTDVRINQATALPASAEPTDEAILALVEASTRRNVRKALRLGIEARPDLGALRALCELHQANMADIGGLSKTWEFFAAVRRHFSPGEQFDVYAARLDGEVVAALLVFWHNVTAEYFTPAIDHDHRSDQPLATILLRALADAVRRGMRWFNWGGTWESQDGVFRFKRKWGARAVRYPYYVQVNDRSLLHESPEHLRERFGHFYVAPFSALEPKGVPS
jgi:CelD/BcsL family acetyltransferase involved in cellulose biosynthesis